MAGRCELIAFAAAALLAAPVTVLAEPANAAVPPEAPARESVFGDLSLGGARDEPISVRSDKLELSYRDRLLTYSGEVVVTQGDLTLRARTLQVTISDERRDRLEKITALGNVEITQGNRSASGERAIFNQRERTIELTENAVLSEGPNRISGNRVIVYLDEERSVVEGGQGRVQALLYPGDDLRGLGERSGAPQP